MIHETLAHRRWTLCLSVIIIFFGLSIAGKAGAYTYNNSGTLTSINLLSGQIVWSIDSFVYNLSAKPSGTTATVQFSQDGTVWYNSSNTPNGTNTLTTGVNNSINLSNLQWVGGNFYYKVAFSSSDGETTPVFDDITLNYTGGANNPPNNPTNSTPTDGQPYRSATGTLVASSYSDTESNAQTDAQWQADDDSDFSSPVWTRTAGGAETTIAMTTANGTFANELSGQTQLAYGVTYYWRVRYSDGHWSSWSNTTGFRTTPYYSPAYFSSVNLLSGRGAASIGSFDYTLSAKPTNTDATVQFSQDNTTWYNSANTLNGSDTLTTGTNSISLATLAWTGSSFYYRVTMTTSDGLGTPVLDDITVIYTATTATWNGSSSNDWSVGANWDINTVPGNYHDIVIADVTNQPVMSANTGLHNLTIQTGGTLDVNGYALTLNDSGVFSNFGTLRLHGDETLTSFTNDTDSGTVEYDGTGTYISLSAGNSYKNIRFTNSGNWKPDSAMDVNGTFTMTGGTFQQGAYRLNIAGNVTIDSGAIFTKSSNGSLLILDGDLTLTDNTASKQNLGYLQIGTSPDTIDLATDITAWKIDVGTGDTLNTNGYDLTIGTGSLTLYGTLNATDDGAGNGTVISLSGNWIKKSTGTFTHGTGAVTLNGTNQTLSGSTTFYNLTKSIVSADTLTFAATATQTVAGTLTLKGVGGSPLQLRSSQTGSYAYLTVLAGTSPVLQYLNVRDSNASNGQTLVCPTAVGCVNAVGNVNWSFPVPAATGDGGPSTWLLNLRRENNLSLGGQPTSGGGGGGASSSEIGITSFVPDYAPLAQAMKDAQERARETADAVILDPRRIPAIREALIARFNAQISGADRRNAEPHFAPAGASRGEPHYPEGATRGEVTASGTSLSRIAKRRGLLSAIVNDEEVLYRDVNIYAWYAPYVSLLIEENVAQGYKDENGKPTGEFGTANPVTREEVLKMALEAAKTDLTGAGSPRNRTAQGRWSAAYVALAESLELSVFRSSINVQEPATRGEVIQTILEVMRFPMDIKIPSPFTDVSAAHPHAKAIITAAAFGLIEGDTSPDGTPRNTFRPDESINRAEAAKIIALVQELMR